MEFEDVIDSRKNLSFSFHWDYISKEVMFDKFGEKFIFRNRNPNFCNLFIMN